MQCFIILCKFDHNTFCAYAYIAERCNYTRRYPESQNFYVYRLVLQMFLPNAFDPGVKSRMKI